MWDDFNTTVRGIDVAALDRAGLGDLAGMVGSTRAVLDGLEARIAAALRKLGASEASTAETLRRRTGCSAREARHRTRRAEVLQKMPNVADALADGRLTGEHATALARAAAETSPEAVDGDAGLLAEAESLPADIASSKARDWARRRQTDDDLHRLHMWQRRNRSLGFTAGEGGMLTGIAKLDRVSGAQLQTLVETLADQLYRSDGGRDNPAARSRAQCRHDALLALVGIESEPPAAPNSADGASGADRGAVNGGVPSGLCLPGAEPLPARGADGDGDGMNGRCLLPDPTGGAVPDGRRSDGATSLTGTDGTAVDCGFDGSVAGLRPWRPGASVGPGCTCGSGLGARAQLCIVVDLPYLAGNGRDGRCEIPGIGPIARSEFERLACDADIYGLVFDGRGVSLHHGRKIRPASPQQWRALLARDRGCVICGARPSWCQAHHVVAWARGGPTDIDNLALVCHTHHRWIHDNNITLRRGPNGWEAPPGLPPPHHSEPVQTPARLDGWKAPPGLPPPHPHTDRRTGGSAPDMPRVDAVSSR